MEHLDRGRHRRRDGTENQRPDERARHNTRELVMVVLLTPRGKQHKTTRVRLTSRKPRRSSFRGCTHRINIGAMHQDIVCRLHIEALLDLGVRTRDQAEQAHAQRQDEADPYTEAARGATIHITRRAHCPRSGSY